MKSFITTVALLSLLLAPCAVLANDPAGSWLAYTIASSTKGGKILSMNATTTIPSNPAQDGASPAFWPGIEPSPATNILQPIVKWEAFGWNIFAEYFQWSNFYDWQSQPITVQPGDKIFTSINYVPANNSYTMYVHSQRTGLGVGGNIAVQQGKTYVDAYLVVEHQPSSCSQYPASGSITWTDINVVWEGGESLSVGASGVHSTGPKWTAHTFQDQCNTLGHVLPNGDVKFTWSTQ